MCWGSFWGVVGVHKVTPWKKKLSRISCTAWIQKSRIGFTLLNCYGELKVYTQWGQCRGLTFWKLDLIINRHRILVSNTNCGNWSLLFLKRSVYLGSAALLIYWTANLYIMGDSDSWSASTVRLSAGGAQNTDTRIPYNTFEWNGSILE